jgi:hypothetical protein
MLDEGPRETWNYPAWWQDQHSQLAIAKDSARPGIEMGFSADASGPGPVGDEIRLEEQKSWT